MSAFIISDDCMQNVIRGIEKVVSDSPAYWNKLLQEVDAEFVLSQGHIDYYSKLNYQYIGMSLMQLNQAALTSRYGKCEEMPE